MGNTCGRPCGPHDPLKDRLLPDMLSNSTLFYLMGKYEEIKIIDCTYTPEGGKSGDNYYNNYLRAALPGAQLLDLDSLQNSGESDWEDEFPSKRSFIVRMRRLGIRPTDKVVCYSQTAETVHYAARALFILKAFGYKDVKMLSGSLESWSQAEFPTSPGETEDPFDGGHGYDELCQKQDDFFISMQDIVYNIKLGGDKKFPQLIDSTPERQRILLAKNSERSLLHIPNAVKMEIGSIMYMNGELKPPTELLTQFKQLGIILKRPIICYGYLANEACLFFLVLKALGAKNVKLYDRGFQEYHTNPSTLPLENYDQGLH